MKEKEKQIEELTNALIFTARCGTYRDVAEHLYNIGYRKQSEVAREIFEEIDQYIEQNGFGQFYKEYIKDIVSELKKKYTEGNNG